MSNEKLEWNVLRLNVNTKQIEIYNIFNHPKFKEDCDSAWRSLPQYNNFDRAIKDNLMYYFWSKYEWEIFIQVNPDSIENIKKIDVYDQVMMNWDRFINYVKSYYISQKQQ